MKKTTAGLLAVLALVLHGWSCKGLPAEPDVVATPTPEPTLAPPDPRSSPSPGDSAGSFSCPLPKMPDHGDCRNAQSEFAGNVLQAIENLIRDKPQLFDVYDRAGCDTCVRLVDGPGFERAMVAEMGKMGLCAQCDEECGVKNTNAWNEQFKLSNSTGYLLKPEKYYKVTCFPAAF